MAKAKNEIESTNKNIVDSLEERKSKKISLETMTAVGKKTTLAGREYIIAPITLRDMDIFDSNLILPIMQNADLDDISYAINVIDKERAKIFYYIVEKYARYKDGKIPVTEELVEEHNWSIKDLKHFLEVWLQISD